MSSATSKTANISALLANKKTRNVILATLGAVSLVSILAIVMVNRRPAPLPLEVRGAEMVRPQASDQRQMGEMDPAYKLKFEQQNAQQATEAERTGASTMVRIGDDPRPVDRTKATEPPRAEAAPAPQQQAPRATARAGGKPEEPHPAIAELIAGRWAPTKHMVHANYPAQEYRLQDPVSESAATSAVASSSVGTGEDGKPAASSKPLYQAGDISVATVVNKLNSDNPNILIATLQTGPLAGGRLLGTYKAGTNGVGITGTFDRLAAKDGAVYSIKAQVLSEKDYDILIASNVDRKVFARYVVRPLAYFAKGFSEAILANVNTGNVAYNGSTGISVMEKNKLSVADQARVGLGKVGDSFIKDIEQGNMKPTTTVDPNEVIAVVFLDRVDASKAK